jgi:Protein of unknown function (DUF3309)
MSLGTILLIILVIALLGGFSGLGGGPFYGTGYYGGGGLGLILVVVLILVLLGKLWTARAVPPFKIGCPCSKTYPVWESVCRWRSRLAIFD